MDNVNRRGKPQSGELGHSLKSRHVTMISLGGVVGAGLFIGAGAAIHYGGPGVFLVYAACGLLVVLNMRILGEMAVAQPQRGSFATYVGNALGPWAGFTTRWLYWYCQLFAIGAETVAGAKLLQLCGFPGPVWATGLELMALLTLLNLVSVRAYGELEFWLASLKIVAIGLFLAIGLVFIVFAGPGLHHAFVNMTGNGGLFPNGIAGLIAAIPIVTFSMFGSEMATIAAAESDDPAGNVAKAGRRVALRVAIFYVSSIVLIVAIAPWNTVTVGSSPFKSALDVIGIPGSSQVMAIVILTAVLSCLNSGIYVSSRMLHELGKSGGGPAFLSRTGANQVPTVGVLFACTAGSMAAIGQLFLKQDVFTLLISSTGAIGLFITGLNAVAQIHQRRRLDAAGVHLPVKMWLFPWLSYAVILAMVGVLATLAMVPEQRTSMLLSALALAIVAGGWQLRRGNHHETVQV